MSKLIWMGFFGLLAYLLGASVLVSVLVGLAAIVVPMVILFVLIAIVAWANS